MPFGYFLFLLLSEKQQYSLYQALILIFNSRRFFNYRFSSKRGCFVQVFEFSIKDLADKWAIMVVITPMHEQ
jgi:hypothetical protein